MSLNSAGAQSVGVKTDRNNILIGERVVYELLVNLPSPGYAVNFRMPDSIPHFDIIENNNFDTINSNETFSIHKKIVFTSFDSGTQYIPSFELLVERGQDSKKYLTDSILVEVGYSPADSSGQLRDIKPVMEVNITDYTWYYIAAVILLAWFAGWLIYRFIKKSKKKEKPIFESALSPYEEAMKSLSVLSKSELREPIDVKNYYTSLVDIFKRYLSRKTRINLLNNTTSDILLQLREQKQEDELLSSLAGALRTADAVKFAKYIPAVTDTETNFDRVKDAVEMIEKKQSPPKQ